MIRAILIKTYAMNKESKRKKDEERKKEENEKHNQ